MIGVRSRVKAHVSTINALKNTTLLYCCDVDDVILEAHNIWCQKNMGHIPKVEKDFRKILNNKEVDAVFIATPQTLAYSHGYFGDASGQACIPKKALQSQSI